MKKEKAKVTLEKEDEKEGISTPLKTKDSIFGINLSVNSALMIVGASLLYPEVVMSK